MTSAPRIAVDHERCVGNGQCVALAPAVFRHNDAVQSEVVDPLGAPLDVLQKAVRFCPTGAIRLLDADGEVAP